MVADGETGRESFDAVETPGLAVVDGVGSDEVWDCVYRLVWLQLEVRGER